MLPKLGEMLRDLRKANGVNPGRMGGHEGPTLPFWYGHTRVEIGEPSENARCFPIGRALGTTERD